LVEESSELTSLEICSGAGGAALGLRTAGFSSVGLIELNAHAVTTLLANRQLGPVIFNDVCQIDYTSYVGKIDLFAGGVPCQPHSVLGNQEGENDERDLFAHSVEMIRLIQPRAVMLENVSGFAHRQAALYRAQIFEGLRKAGYDAELFATSASDFGLAQARPRLVFVAMRDGLMSRFKMPPVMSPVPLGIGDALRDLMAENGWIGADV
jgi:DNA (cytosine-5)-methyltransferase 1